MKETGTEYWQSPNTGATNSSGFSARGNGFRYAGNGTYSSIKSYTYTWSGTSSGGKAYYRRLAYNNTNLNEYLINKNYGFGVRCLED